MGYGDSANRLLLGNRRDTLRSRNRVSAGILGRYRKSASRSERRSSSVRAASSASRQCRRHRSIDSSIRRRPPINYKSRTIRQHFLELDNSRPEFISEQKPIVLRRCSIRACFVKSVFEINRDISCTGVAGGAYVTCASQRSSGWACACAVPPVYGSIMTRDLLFL